MRQSKPASFYLIRPRDQATLAVVLGSLLLMIWGYWHWAGGDREQLIDIDKALPLQARFLVDINQATAAELMQLPNIGRTLAERILDERKNNGPFASLEDLDRVHGIGPLTMDRIEPYLLFIPGNGDWE
jgi:competence protein ComEA